MYFCLLGFDLNSIYCRVRGVIFTFPIPKINVCGHNLLFNFWKEGGLPSTFAIYRSPFSHFV